MPTKALRQARNAEESSVFERPPSGSGWVHEIKHDGFRLMARRDPVGIRLLTRNGHDWAARYPLIVEAVNRLWVRSCLIDGEAVCCGALAQGRVMAENAGLAMR